MSDADWGVPDGHTTTDYGSIEDWSSERWRWEFKRRTWVVRHAFMNLVMEEQKVKTGFLNPDPMWAEEYREEVFHLAPAEAATVGYGALPNPIYSERPSRAIEHESSLSARTILPWHFLQAVKGEANEFSALGFGNIAITFNPNAPLEPQLQGLKDHLSKRRTDPSQMENKRLHKAKFFTYLRVLDAKEAGMSWSKVSQVLPTTSARSPQSARDAYDQALRIQKTI